MWHKLAHLFGIFYGECYSWYDKDKLMMGFRCTKCGNIYGVHEVPSHIFNYEAERRSK